tara:strand:+ start:310 stop:678 length:369 start_codon:yes stop_codon:yes gene_type:complete
MQGKKTLEILPEQASVLYHFLGVAVLIDLPNIEYPIPVKIDNSLGTSSKIISCDLDDLISIICGSALVDRFGGLKIEFVEFHSVLGIEITVLGLEIGDVFQLYLGLLGLGLGDQRHELGECQ